MEGGGSEEKKLLCCFVVANKEYYDFYALDFYKASGKGDDKKYEVSGDVEKYEVGVGGDDESYELDDYVDIYGPVVGDDLPVIRHLPRLPDPFLTIPKSSKRVEDGYPDEMAFGLLGGMLYMVSPCGDVYVFDTRYIPSSSPAAPLDHNMCVTIGPELNSWKQVPIVIPLAGKLFVFCSSLYPGPDEYTEHVIEVLVPENKCWSPIQLPPTLIEYAKKNPYHLDDTPDEYAVYNPYFIESHATVGNSIVLYLDLDDSNLKLLLVLDAETLSWKTHVDLQITRLAFLEGCLFWNGIWCTANSCSGVLLKLEEQGMEDILKVRLPSNQVNMTSGKVVRVDDNTLLVFSYGMITRHYLKPCPDYFKLDMLRVDKRKRDIDGVDKLTANVVDSMEFSFKKYSPGFKLAYCYSLGY